MKARNEYILIALAALLMIGCKKNSNMLTIINEDGTCMRELSFHTTPQKLMLPPDSDLDNYIDKSWERTWTIVDNDSVRHPVPMTEAQYDSIQQKNFRKYVPDLVTMHVRKKFKNVQEMAEQTPLDDTKYIKASSSLDNHFKWFYTDYTFTETFAYVGNVKFVPISRFLSADTASYWFTGQPDLTRNYSGAELKEMLDGIEAKVSQWINANWFARIYDEIASDYNSIQNPPVSKEQFVSLRDTLATHPAILNTDLLDGSMKDFMNVLDDYYHSSAYSDYIHKWSGGYDSLKRDPTYLTMVSFQRDYDLVMPGRVLDAGMGEYDGNVIHYRVSGDRTIPNDYKYSITATSRVTNVWAFIVTILVVLLAIGSFFYRRKA